MTSFPFFCFVVETASLTQKQIEDVRTILSYCRQDVRANRGISFPFEDEESRYFLFYSREQATVSPVTPLKQASEVLSGDDPLPLEIQTLSDVPALSDIPPRSATPVLCGVLALSCIEEGAFECTSYVLPEKRRKGIAKTLLEHALNSTKKRIPDSRFTVDFLFDDASPYKEVFSRAVGAKFLTRELHMELSFKKIRRSGAFSAESEKHSEENGYRILPKKNDGKCFFIYYSDKKIGSYSLLENGASLWFYKFQIYKKYRGMGHGSAVFPLILEKLRKEYGEKKETVSLQVSGDNLPALTMYEKYGFTVKSALAYYRKSVSSS